MSVGVRRKVPALGAFHAEDSSVVHLGDGMEQGEHPRVVVTTITARSGASAAPASSSMTDSPVAWSRAAVGSSQTTSFGPWMSAAREATRCCCPPESREGRGVRSLRHSQLSRSPQARLTASRCGTPPPGVGRRHSPRR